MPFTPGMCEEEDLRFSGKKSVEWDAMKSNKFMSVAMSPWRKRIQSLTQNGEKIFQYFQSVKLCENLSGQTIRQNMWKFPFISPESTTCSLNLIRRIVRPQIWLYLFSIINKGRSVSLLCVWLNSILCNLFHLEINSHLLHCVLRWSLLVHKNSSLPSFRLLRGRFLPAMGENSHAARFTSAAVVSPLCSSACKKFVWGVENFRCSS